MGAMGALGALGALGAVGLSTGAICEVSAAVDAPTIVVANIGAPIIAERFRYTRVAIFGRSPARSSPNSIASRSARSSRHIEPVATVMRTPRSFGGYVVDLLIMSCVPM
jgi:hypothetical protein